MSIPRKFEVNCPKCGKKYQATIFESINSDFAPNVAETIISGDRFDATCPECGFVARLEYDVLYHDMKHGAMIWVVHENNSDRTKKIAEVRSTPLLPYKTTRIVANMNELREKVACLESEKDDRVVELCKVFLSGQLMKQQPDFKFSNAFYTYAGGKNIVFFYDDNGKEMSCYLENQVYDLICDMFAVPLSRMDNSPYKIINHNWAVDFFELLPADNEEVLEDQNQERDEMPVSSDTDDKAKSDVTENDTPSSDEVLEQQPLKRAFFCRRCGAKLLSDSLFCSYCGTEVIYQR